MERPDNALPGAGGGAGEGPRPGPSPHPPPEEGLLLVLCYLGLLALVPYLVARQREALRFHARQGLALAILEVGCAGVTVIPLVGFAGVLGLFLCLALSIVGIVKALGGQRWRMPVAADLVERLDL